MNSENKIKAAKILYNHKFNCSGLNSLPLNCISKNVDEAYLIQNELIKLYLSIKDNFIIGKKVGCTNVYAQKQINVNEPFYGTLFSKFSSYNNSKLFAKNFYKPFVEPEFSFKIKKDIDISKAPFNSNTIIEYIESIIPCIEIVDFRFNKKLNEIGINNLVSNNGASEHWIRGSKEFNFHENDLSDQIVKIHINEKLVDTGNSSNVLNNPINSLVWLINKISIKGETLLKNYVVSTGTCTKALPIKKGDKILANFGKFGVVKFNLN